MKRNVLNDAVALIEDAEHRGTLSHRRHTALAIGCGGDLRAGGSGRILLFPALAAGGERKGDQQQRSGGAVHAYSGIHGS
jgi:hypothetical protein